MSEYLTGDHAFRTGQKVKVTLNATVENGVVDEDGEVFLLVHWPGTAADVQHTHIPVKYVNTSPHKFRVGQVWHHEGFADEPGGLWFITHVPENGGDATAISEHGMPGNMHPANQHITLLFDPEEAKQ